MGATSELVINMQDELMNTIHRAEEGEMSYLDAAIALRQEKSQLEDSLKIIKEFEDDNRSLIEQEAKEYNNEYKGYKFEFRNGKKLWDYKGIPEWNKLDERKKAIEAQAKAAFDLFQKTSAKPMTEDGEMLPLPDLNYAKGSMVVKPLK